MNLSDLDETALGLAIGVDRDALAEAYRRHAAAVHALARRVLGGAAAGDVVQEVFIRLLDEPEKFDPARGSLRTYLLTLAHRRAIDTLRCENARKSREEREGRGAEVRSNEVEENVISHAIASQVKSAVATLRHDERQAIELAYFGGLTYRQVAVLLGEPEGTIKGRLRAGLRHLRAALARSGSVAWTGA